MKRLSRIVPLALIIGLIVGLPAATQTTPMATDGSSGAGTADNVNLGMLILINRLELSDAQMSSLYDILAGLLDQGTTLKNLRVQFENDMIVFSGTSDELDALLSSYQDDRQAAIDAFSAAVDTARDQIGDLLTANQGAVLQQTLPGLLTGTGIGNGTARSTMTGRLGGRGVIMPQSFGQGSNSEDSQTSSSQLRTRLQQLEDQISEQTYQRSGGRSGTATEDGTLLRQRMSEGTAQAVLGKDDSRGPLRRMLEQVVQILELKMEAVG